MRRTTGRLRGGLVYTCQGIESSLHATASSTREAQLNCEIDSMRCLENATGQFRSDCKHLCVEMRRALIHNKAWRIVEAMKCAERGHLDIQQHPCAPLEQRRLVLASSHRLATAKPKRRRKESTRYTVIFYVSYR